MKLAVSNIAWPVERDADVAALLTAMQVQGIEVAPTKIWPDLLTVTDAAVDAYRKLWNDRGIEIVAAQALLFGKPELTLFDDSNIRAKTSAYLRKIIRLCSRLGCGALVFGSPKNRRAGDRPRDDVWNIAVDFFGKLGEYAAAEGTTLVMEANPSDYGADFIVRADEAAALVGAVNQSGFRLHLDSGCMTLAGDEPEKVIPQFAPLLSHFHISEPGLAPLGIGGVEHARFAESLRRIGYGGWASIEMRQAESFELNGLRLAIERARSSYG